MTNEEVISVLSDIDHAWRNFSQKEYIALEMAIKALSSQNDTSIEQALLLEVIDKCLPNPCDDAISREDAIKALQKVACYSAAIRARMIGAIEDLPSVTQKSGKWIPVSERLPDKNGRYLVTVKQGYITFGAWIDEAKNWENVIAWMPLPKPYEPQERSDKE